MQLNEINSLVELFYKSFNQNNLQPDRPFLKWLKLDDKFLTWGQVEKKNKCSIKIFK